MTVAPTERGVEAASLRAWPALEEEELHGWTLRYSEGFTGRANSVQALGSGTLSLADRVVACERWYAERGRPCLFRLSRLSEPDLDGFLEARGYERRDPTLVLWRDVAGASTHRKPLGGSSSNVARGRSE